ncbi:MAG: hypothetical protein ACRCV6_00695 [Formosimonas sp.]
MDDAKMEVAKKIFNHMRFLWPIDVSEQLLNTIFKACCGPSLGSHADATTNELFIPLINDGKLKVESLWHFFSNIFTGKIMDVHPYLHSDAPIYSSVGYLSQFISEEARNIFIQTINKLVVKEKRSLNQPFIQSIDYESFNASNVVLHNILFAIKCMRSNAPDFEDYKFLIDNIEAYLRGKGIYLQLPNHELIHAIESIKST